MNGGWVLTYDQYSYEFQPQKIMKLTLKNFRSAQGTDGDAFSVEIWHKGKKVCDVIQSGTGGPNLWYWIDRKAEGEFNAHISNLSERGAFEYDFEQSDQYLAEMLDFRLKRHKKLIFRLKNAPLQYQAVNGKDSPKTRTWLQKQFGESIFEVVNDRYEAKK